MDFHQSLKEEAMRLSETRHSMLSSIYTSVLLLDRHMA